MRSDSPTCSGLGGVARLGESGSSGGVGAGSSGARSASGRAKDGAGAEARLPHVGTTSETGASSGSGALNVQRVLGGAGLSRSPAEQAGPRRDISERTEAPVKTGKHPHASGNEPPECADRRVSARNSDRRKEKSPEAISRFGALVINLATTYSPTHARAQYHRLWRA